MIPIIISSTIFLVSLIFLFLLHDITLFLSIIICLFSLLTTIILIPSTYRYVKYKDKVAHEIFPDILNWNIDDIVSISTDSSIKKEYRYRGIIDDTVLCFKNRNGYDIFTINLRCILKSYSKQYQICLYPGDNKIYITNESYKDNIGILNTNTIEEKLAHSSYNEYLKIIKELQNE